MTGNHDARIAALETVAVTTKKLVQTFPERMAADSTKTIFNIPAYIVAECREALDALDKITNPGSPAPRGKK